MDLVRCASCSVHGMKKSMPFFAALSLVLACDASSDDGGSLRSERVVLDVRCDGDGDCPSGFECETEAEHGAAATYCKSHQGGAPSANAPATSSCPPGFEQETEHGGIFCKPHGGAKDGGEAPSSGDAAAGAACTTDADCAPDLECETELEHGVATAFCKPHGGGKGGKGGKG